MKQHKMVRVCVPSGVGSGCCSVAAVVSVDERGQVVLPKELRDRAKIKSGDKLAIIAVGAKEKLCCLLLMKAAELDQMVTAKVGSVLSMKEV